MLIRCPTCASGHEVPSDLLRDGRILRCGYCREAWVHSGAASRPEGIGVAIAAEARSSRSATPAAPRERVLSPRRRASRRSGSSVAAAALVLATVAGGMAVVAQRDRVVAAFRPSAAAFAALGLPVNLRGLALGGIRSTLATADGAATLTLDGSITNLRPVGTDVPAIRIAVRDATDRELYYWTAPAPKDRLAVGETVPFHSRLSAPPREGETLAVSFADPVTATRRRVAEASPPAR